MSCFVPNLFVSCVGFYISYNQHWRFLLRTKVEQFRFSDISAQNKARFIYKTIQVLFRVSH